MSEFDPLLKIRDGFVDARWNFTAAAGTPVNNPGGIGTPALVTYSFMSALPAHDLPAAHPNFTAFDAALMDGARRALGEWSAVSNLAFTEVADAGDGGAIRFGRHLMEAGGYAQFPHFSYRTQDGVILPGMQPGNPAGDIYLGLYAENAALAPGDYGYNTLVHETGHAIGLKHPFEGSLTLPAETSTRAHTVMAYAAPANAQVVTVTGTAEAYSWTSTTLYPSGPMLYDIAAAQYLYGPNASHATGNDTYAWATNARFFDTIWDAGGNDTIDASNQVLRCVIDLADGRYSSIGLRQTVAELRLEIPAFVTDAPNPSYNGQNNLAIAYGAVIENARGGAGDDAISGNAAANALFGGAGNDVLNGGAAADGLHGGSGNDTYLVDSLGDITFEYAGEGNDLVIADIAGAGYYLHYGTEALVVVGNTGFGAGNDLANPMTGSAMANHLLGRAGNDTLSGKGGDDLLFGEEGADAFIVERGTGSDVLGDFTPGVDLIWLADVGLRSFAEVLATTTDIGGSATIELGQGDQITVSGVSRTGLLPGDFLFG